uniref:Uncharacterized protein n=1 Tax=Scophthalmus maximus TaxID=52904 RepID=A0A8D3DAE5_SCOMX
VFPVQPVGFISGDEELRAIRTSPYTPSMQVTKLTWSGVFEDKVFVVKLLAVDGLAASAVVVGEVASLAHELRDDAVEAAALEAKAFLVCSPCRLVANLDVHVDLRVNSALFSWGLVLQKQIILHLLS